MDNLQVFSNEDFGSIRTLEINGEPWFVGKDVARALGYKDTVNTLKYHVENDDKMGWQITTPSRGKQTMTIINESGLYSLIFSSGLESARKFKHWVTSEVLPAIRKTGFYNQNFYKVKDTSLGDVAKFVREMDKVMRDQNSHPSDIAEAFQGVCEQFGIRLPDNFVKEPVVSEPVHFITLEEIYNS